MGDGENALLRLQFNPRVRLEFRGAAITSDAGLLSVRELDDVLGLTHIAHDYLQESRSGRPSAEGPAPPRPSAQTVHLQPSGRLR